MSDRNTMPVTIITGFLGAGKTTLLNQLLKKYEHTKFLIIENEAGNVNIDSQLLNGNTQNKVFELTNGCICCSLSTELGTLLNSLILSRVKYDYVLIEATGMADPGQIIEMFSGKRVQRYFELDSVVCMIDAESVLNRVDNFDEVSKQIAQSDYLIINKTDLISAEKIPEVEQKLASINPFAQTEKTTFGELNDNKILNSKMFHPPKLEKSIIDFSHLTLLKPQTNHAHQIQTIGISITGCFNMEKVAQWFENFLSLNAETILRIKAILCITDMKHKMILQSVGKSYHVTQGSLWKHEEEKESQIVFIGTDLNKQQIQNELSEL